MTTIYVTRHSLYKKWGVSCKIMYFITMFLVFAICAFYVITKVHVRKQFNFANYKIFYSICMGIYINDIIGQGNKNCNYRLISLIHIHIVE